MNINASRSAAWAILILASILLCAPLIVAYSLHFEHAMHANESIAYRFFFSLRILKGEIGVWTPQGNTLNLVQNGIHLLAGTISTNADNLRQNLWLFGYWTNAFVVLCQVFVVAATVICKRLSTMDRIAVVGSLLIPIYGTGAIGIYYQLLPDYYSLNVALNAFALLIFLMGVRKCDEAPEWLYFAGIGIVAGLMLGNKISMAPVAILMTVPWVVSGEAGWKACLSRGFVIGITTFLTVALILSGQYLFDIQSLVSSFRGWYAFVSNPGTEPGFWGALASAARSYNYGLIIIISVPILIGSIVLISRQKYKSFAFFLCAIAPFFVIAAWVFFVFKRPANTTLFEAINALVVASFAFAVLPSQDKPWRVFIGISTAAYMVMTIATFPLRQNLDILASSSRAAESRWGFFNELRAAIGDRPLTILMPSNDYGHGGIHEILLKGMSTPPTWEVDAAALNILAEMGMPYSFRHTYGGTAAYQKSFSPGSWIVWFDKDESQYVLESSPTLRKIVSGASTILHWSLPTYPGGGAPIEAFAVYSP